MFAGGCFWGTEHLFSLVEGVLHTQAGYANGPDSPPPTYEAVCAGTGHAEAVWVEYNPAIISLKRLISLYWLSIDPLDGFGQGPDRGSQYRPGIYYAPMADIPAIHACVSLLEGGRKSAVEVLPLSNFFPAEKHHQRYLEKNPAGYCHVPLALFRKAEKGDW